MSLEQTKADWERLGKSDPLWAVLVDPKGKNNNWDVAEFFATGRAEVDQALSRLTELGGSGGAREVALDFGCGVGRLTQALAAHYAEVIGVDISEPMLEHARRFDETGGRARFVHNTAADLAQIPDASVDLVYSSIVLQHIPREAAWQYLRDFTRIVRPGGAIVIQVPTRIRPTVKGVLSVLVPFAVQRWVQQRLMGYPAPMRMQTFRPAELTSLFEEKGFELAGAFDESGYSPHWTVTRFYAIRKG